MLNKKGLTILELLISIVLLSIVLVFLYSLLFDVKDDSENSDYAFKNQVNRAEAIYTIERDLYGTRAVNVEVNNYETYDEIKFIYIDNKRSTLKIYSNESGVYYLEYTDIKGVVTKWEMKDATIDRENIRKYTSSDASGNFYFRIVIPVYNKNYNANNNAKNNNTIDDIEFNYTNKVSKDDSKNYETEVKETCNDEDTFGGDKIEQIDDSIFSKKLGGLYRYQGTDPNNYICFGTVFKNTCLKNKDKFLYRIIGITDDGKIKVIRPTKYGKFKRNTAYWKNSPVRTTLNETFLNDTSYFPEGWVDKIETVTWGGHRGSEVTYNGNTFYYNYANGEITTWSAADDKIGHIEVTDYLYAKEDLNADYTACKNSWIHISKSDTNEKEWTMDEYANPHMHYLYTIQTDGKLVGEEVSYQYAVRPTFYIKNNVRISGSGTLTDPYIVDGYCDVQTRTVSVIVANDKGSVSPLSKVVEYDGDAEFVITPGSGATLTGATATCSISTDVSINTTNGKLIITGVKSDDICLVTLGTIPQFAPTTTQYVSDDSGDEYRPEYSSYTLPDFDYINVINFTALGNYHASDAYNYTQNHGIDIPCYDWYCLFDALLQKEISANYCDIHPTHCDTYQKQSIMTFTNNYLGYQQLSNPTTPNPGYSGTFKINTSEHRLYYATSMYQENTIAIQFGKNGYSPSEWVIFSVYYICVDEDSVVYFYDDKKKKFKKKKIKDVTYDDELLVWDFDNGCFTTAKPLWIKQIEVADEYHLLKFSDGSTLKTINHHRIFNKEKGAFTYPMTADTPIGTTSFNSKGEEVKLVSVEKVYERIKYCNVITNYHMNLFTNDILTSCRLNNIYPIKDMKFVKDNRKLKDISEYKGIDKKWYDGLRLSEYDGNINKDGSHRKDIYDYIDRLESKRKV